MAEQVAEQAAENTPEKLEGEKEQNGKKKTIMIILAIVPIVSVLTFFSITKFISPRLESSAAHASVETEEAEETTGYTWELGEVLANPYETNNLHIMKVAVALELDSEELGLEIEKSRKRLLDSLMMVLTAKTLNMLTSPEGKTALKLELKNSFTSEAGMEEGDIRRVYFTQFVIQ